tara:strand:+ start:883 stop:1023 length:141 start_codon:yes stop_codon:yes gene_type:complete
MSVFIEKYGRMVQKADRAGGLLAIGLFFGKPFQNKTNCKWGRRLRL